MDPDPKKHVDPDPEHWLKTCQMVLGKIGGALEFPKISVFIHRSSQVNESTQKSFNFSSGNTYMF
jgi:hypothetical protein